MTDPIVIQPNNRFSTRILDCYFMDMVFEYSFHSVLADLANTLSTCAFIGYIQKLIVGFIHVLILIIYKPQALF